MVCSVVKDSARTGNTCKPTVTGSYSSKGGHFYRLIRLKKFPCSTRLKRTKRSNLPKLGAVTVSCASSLIMCDAHEKYSSVLDVKSVKET